MATRLLLLGAEEVQRELHPLAQLRLAAYAEALAERGGGGGGRHLSDNLAWRVARCVAQRSGVQTVAGAEAGDAGPRAAQLNGPSAIFVTADDVVYVSDMLNHRVQRWAVGATAGQTVAGGNGTGQGLHQLSRPRGLFVTDEGVYVADGAAHRVVLWPHGAAEGKVVAGGRGRGAGPHQLCGPSGLLVTADGDVLVVDTENDRVVRWPRGAAAGVPVACGVRLRFPVGLCWDAAAGELLVCDSSNDRVLRLSADGTATVVAQDTPHAAEDRDLCTLNHPCGVAVLPGGALVLADTENHRVVLWHPGAAGPALTLAGGSGHGGSAAQLIHPCAVAVRGTDLYVCDQGNSRVQLVSLPPF